MANGPTASGIRRLIVCCDGTWNTPESHTNVSRIYAAITDAHANCNEQLKFYEPGVGTTRMSRLSGGAFGVGLDQNILRAYCWLINEFPIQRAERQTVTEVADGETFDTGPDIFIFGFSRGAYTARSLAGLINRCGLPRGESFKGEQDPATGKTTDRAHPDSTIVRAAWDLYRESITAPEGTDTRQHPRCVEFRAKNSWTVKIKFVGVWDTVGALGVPALSGTPLANIRYGFHDTSLGRVVENAYHAVAIDEEREDYKVTLWDKAHPSGTKDVEQRWFPGAHANVGGGYEDDLLPDAPLKWMAEKALAQGLEFNDEFSMKLGQAKCQNALPESFKLRGDEYLSPVRDSYAEFMGGAYRITRGLILKGRYWRPMLTAGVHETIDVTAHLKWAVDPTYRPINFAAAGGT